MARNILQREYLSLPIRAAFSLLLLLSSFSQAIAAEQAARYISLAPSTTEILFALGLDEEIVGVSSFCNYPPEASGKTKVGDFSRPNMEIILALKPDYIFCTGLEQAPVIEQLRRLKLNVYVADPSSIKQLLGSILEIGKITGREKEAQKIISGITNTVEDARKELKAAGRKRPKVFIEIWHDPLTTAGPGSFVDELLGLAGGINIASDTKRPYSTYSVEQVIMHKPDCIILAYMSTHKPASMVAQRAGWQDVPAVKNKCLFDDINPDIILRPGPRIAEGLKEIRKRIYNQ